jgi:hypothetical protein
MFKIGDWVEITSKSDTRWGSWMSSRDIYDCFRTKIGIIQDICNDDERDGHNLYSIKVNFPDGLGGLNPGHYYEWFRDYHIIMSSKSRANLHTNMSEAGKQLQEWEAFKKKSTDDILRQVFVPKNEESDSKKDIFDDPNQWDLKTPVTKHDDKYDAYYDYSSWNTDYTNSTNPDYAYYTDIGDSNDDSD